jgi:CRISPR-associated DxTHG motif protein
MSRNVFLNFLGTTPYSECIYQLGEEKSNIVKYVQSALFQLTKTKFDKVFIFTTEQAFLKNYNELKEENSSLSIENKMIPNGETENEIWEIFQTVYESLEDEDELTVDITHGFRSSPFLLSALLQYAKFLKNITVQAVYYGALNCIEECRKFPDEPEKRVGKIFDLTPFSLIQDFSSAANEFIKFGNTERLTSLTKSTIAPFAKEAKGQDETINSLRKLSTYIPQLSQAIKLNRGNVILKGEKHKIILDSLVSLQQNLIPPLNPILQKLQADVAPIFSGENDTRNLLLAVQWCIDKGLTQAGITLLQEGIITLLLDKTNYVNQVQERLYASSYLQYYDNDFHESEKLSQERQDDIKCTLSCRPQFKYLAGKGKLYSQIAELRNNINHAGMDGGNRDFEKELKKFYGQVKTIFGIESLI